MSQRLDKLNLVKGYKWERMDPLDNIGVPTYDLIKDAIKEDKIDLAKDLIDYVYFWEIKFVRDAGCDLVGGFPQFFMTRYGEDGLYDIYHRLLHGVHGSDREKPTEPTKPQDMMPFDHAIQHALWMVRPHRMGKSDGTEGFVLEEYEDRYEVVWDPCYTGGRTRRGDPISGTPAHTAPPYEYAVNRAPHTWTWGKTGVTGYCTHCCLLHEIMATEQTGGYLGQWVTGYPENPWDSCRYIAYKDHDWIPEEYYTRIGKVKPKVTSPIPAPKNPKLIKVTHSHDLGPLWKVTDGDQWLNMVPRLNKAIDAGDKEKALKLVDWLWAETALHHAWYPITWNWRWMDLLVEMYGYNELYCALRSFYSRMEPPLSPDERRLTKDEIPDAATRAKRAANWGRGDLSGPNREGSVRIIDEPDRIVMVLDPCGSGGQAIVSQEAASGVALEVAEDLLYSPNHLKARPPLTEPPSNLKVTSEPHAVAWNKVGVPHYCARCCSHFEMAAISRYGYLTTVIERPENATDPSCTWYFYKDLDDIPEKYYNRIGARKPAPQA